ncbi:MFS transporter [Nanoarchaeota archaeon]
MFRKNEWSILKLFYLSDLILNSLFIMYAFFTVYITGIFPFHLAAIILSINFISMVVFEIPTGIIADIFGRKFSSILGIFIGGIAFFCVGLTENFWVLILLFMFIGIANSLNSGAYTAWIVDLLKHKKQSVLTKVLFYRISILQNIGLIVSSLLGLFLVNLYGLKIIWFVTGGAFMIVGVILLFQEEHFIRKKNSVKNHIKSFVKILKESSKYLFKHPIISKLFIYEGLISFMFGLTAIAWEPWLRDLGLPIYLFGLVIFFVAIITIILSALAIKLSDNHAKKTVLINVNIIYLIICLIVMITISPLIGFILLVLKEALWTGVGWPTIISYKHDFYKSKWRATLDSTVNMLRGLTLFVGTIIGGVIASLIGLKLLIVFSSLLIVPSVIILLMIKKHK